MLINVLYHQDAAPLDLLQLGKKKKKHLPITYPTRGRQVPLVFYPEFNNLLHPQSRVRKEDNNKEKPRTHNRRVKCLSKLPILKTCFISESHTSVLYSELSTHKIF